jgi:hypothetical protein
MIVFDPEVAIPLQIIGEESQAQFKREQAYRIEDRSPVRWGYKVSRPGIIAGQDFSGQVNVETDRIRVTFLSCRIAAGTEAVADVIEKQPRPDRVQIDQTDSPAAAPVKQDIVGLGIAMDDMRDKPSVNLGLPDGMHPRTVPLHNIDAMPKLYGLSDRSQPVDPIKMIEIGSLSLIHI